jgi:large subunit ribosomal protein L46
MNTWVVGNHPVGYFEYMFASPQSSKITLPANAQGASQEMTREEHGEKIFFMKARILAGQADLAKNIYGDSEFQWLAKEEIETKVTAPYWSYIRNMLTER